MKRTPCFFPGRVGCTNIRIFCQFLNFTRIPLQGCGSTVGRALGACVSDRVARMLVAIFWIDTKLFQLIINRYQSQYFFWYLGTIADREIAVTHVGWGSRGTSWGC